MLRQKDATSTNVWALARPTRCDSPASKKAALTPDALPRDVFCSLNNRHAFSGGALDIKIAQSLCHRANIAVADDSVVDPDDTGQFAHRSSAKHFVCAIGVLEA